MGVRVRVRVRVKVRMGVGVRVKVKVRVRDGVREGRRHRKKDGGRDWGGGGGRVSILINTLACHSSPTHSVSCFLLQLCLSVSAQCSEIRHSARYRSMNLFHVILHRTPG